MNEVTNKKFLFKTLNGSLLSIKSSNNNIMIFKNTGNDRWTKPFIIENMHSCFCADIDSRDNLHLLTQDLKGNVYYYREEYTRLYKYQILKSTSTTVHDRNLNILGTSSRPVFLYSVQRGNSSELVYQTFSQKGVSIPMPISLVPAVHNSFWATNISSVSALILYPKVSGLYIQICAQTLRLDSLKLSPGVIITREESNCESPKCIVTDSGTVHILYILRKNGRSFLRYLEGNIATFTFVNVKTIVSSASSFRKYNLECSYERLCVNWVENGRIYYREKRTSESEFSRVQLLKLYNVRYLEYYTYKSNTYQEKGRYFSTEQPLSLDGKLHHAFYRESAIPDKLPEHSENLNNDNKLSSTPSYDTFLKVISSYLASQAGNNIDKQREARKVSDFITILSQVLGQTDTPIHQRKDRKIYKIRKIKGVHSFKAARE